MNSGTVKDVRTIDLTDDDDDDDDDTSGNHNGNTEWKNEMIFHFQQGLGHGLGRGRGLNLLGRQGGVLSVGWKDEVTVIAGWVEVGAIKAFR